MSPCANCFLVNFDYNMTFPLKKCMRPAGKRKLNWVLCHFLSGGAQKTLDSPLS